MHKKLMMACMAVAAFAAFVIAPAASASPVLTDGGVKASGTVVGTNTGEAVFSGSGLTIECSNDKLTGSITENSGTSIKGEVKSGSATFKGTETGEDCHSNLGAASATVNSALCFATVSGTDNVTITGCGSAVTFSLSITGTGICRYSTNSVTGTFITNAAATIKLTNQPAKKEEGGIFCPSEGNLNMDFDLKNSSGTALTIS